jgi:catalase-peroxidase
VLGGCAAIEKAAANSGRNIKVPFTAGRLAASPKQTEKKKKKKKKPMKRECEL